jgi:fluoride exporter
MGLLAYIGAGSALGGIGRYLVGSFITARAGSTFPWGTLLINVSGSLVLGMIARYAVDTPAITVEWRAFLAVGLCGGYTTFSTYAYETAALLERGDYRRAGLYASVSVLGTLLATFAGFALARVLLDMRRPA